VPAAWLSGLDLLALLEFESPICERSFMIRCYSERDSQDRLNDCVPATAGVGLPVQSGSKCVHEALLPFFLMGPAWHPIRRVMQKLIVA